ncbi:HEAT repeat domain-containing protein [Streptomyces sp. NPDC001185]|uniref:HEAT repeat domain-containing protein n=1 Tax=Streptomyces sp. NPDC001185 TaxID=3154380 RepID=UPI00331DE89D
MTDGTASTPAHPSRVALFKAIRTDRTGPVATRLLQLAHADSPFVRRGALNLLHDLAGERHWPEAVDAAATRLSDPDEAVRRQAAYFFGHHGEPALVLATLGELTDPVVRTLLARALGPTVAQLTDNDLASVRFLAHLEALRAGPATRWHRLDTALLDDVREAAHHLDDLGRIWGQALHGLGREHETYALVARLLADPATRDIGADLAREACHDWRAAPVRLLPLLVRHRGQGPPRLSTRPSRQPRSPGRRAGHMEVSSPRSPSRRPRGPVRPRPPRRRTTAQPPPRSLPPSPWASSGSLTPASFSRDCWTPAR